MAQDMLQQIDYVNFNDKSMQGAQKQLVSENRFVPIEDRKRVSSLDKKAIKSICMGKYVTTWHGVSLMKDPLDMLIYQQLLWNEAPKAIFEIGTFTGACAKWMADIMRSFGRECHIYTVDIVSQLLDDRCKNDKDITYINGDVNEIDKVFPAEMLKAIPHPWLLIEDAHINVEGIFKYFDQFMAAGDYIIVDDTNPETPGSLNSDVLKGEYEEFGSEKLDQMTNFLQSMNGSYKVDSFYTDFFGYNGTFNWNGYIKKVI